LVFNEDKKRKIEHCLFKLFLSHALLKRMENAEVNERIGLWESIDPAIACVQGRFGYYLEAVKSARSFQVSSEHLIESF